MRKVVSAGLVCLFVGCSAESEIRKKAEFVCKHVSLSSPAIEALPEGAEAGEYLRKEDVQFLREKAKEDDSGLGGAMKVALIPALKALTEARAQVTRCEIDSVTRVEGRATVKLKETTPRPESGSLTDGLERVGQLSKLETHAARVAKAKEWFGAATEKTVVEHAVELIKTDAGWRVDLQLPEKAKAEADAKKREALSGRLLKSSLEVLRDCDLAKARKLIDEAAELTPGEPTLVSARTALEERAPGCIGGKWFRSSSRDAMTDDLNVTVMLTSDNEIEGTFKSSKAMLVGRCAERQFELFVTTDVMLDDTYDVGIEARYRFGATKAERVVFTRSTDHKGAFFRNTATWINTLASNSDERMVLELPIYGSARAVVQFSLAGADKALAEFKTGCSGR